MEDSSPAHLRNPRRVNGAEGVALYLALSPHPLQRDRRPKVSKIGGSWQPRLSASLPSSWSVSSEVGTSPLKKEDAVS